MCSNPLVSLCVFYSKERDKIGISRSISLKVSEILQLRTPSCQAMGNTAELVSEGSNYACARHIYSESGNQNGGELLMHSGVSDRYRNKAFFSEFIFRILLLNSIFCSCLDKATDPTRSSDGVDYHAPVWDRVNREMDG